MWEVLKHSLTVVGNLTFPFSFWCGGYIPAGIVVIVKGYLLLPLQLLFHDSKLSSRGPVKSPWTHCLVKLLMIAYQELTKNSGCVMLSLSSQILSLLKSSLSICVNCIRPQEKLLCQFTYWLKLNCQSWVYGEGNCFFAVNAYFQSYSKPIDA